MRVLREKAGFSVDAAARHIGKNRTTMSRLENGNSPFKDNDLDALLTLYGVNDSHERVALLALNVRLNETKWWWSPYRHHLASWYCSYLVLEAAARYIFTYENRFIPGLLQTPEYAEATIRARFTGEEHVKRLVDIRMHRQDTLLKHPPAGHPATQLWAIIDSSALEDSLDNPEVTRRQIEFLKKVDTDYPNVTVQVVSRGTHAARSNAFSVLRLDAPMLTEVVYLEQFEEALFRDDPARSEPYRIAWSEISLAVSKTQHTQEILELALRRLR